MRFREARPQLTGPQDAGGGIRRLPGAQQGHTDTVVRFGALHCGRRIPAGAEISTTSLIFFPAAARARIISARLHGPKLSALAHAEKAGIAARLTALLRICSRSERR